MQNLIKMYTRSQKQLAEEKANLKPPLPSTEDASKKMREKFAIKMKKMNELKEKQRSILSSEIAMEIVKSESRDREQMLCVICKLMDNPETLFYLCHTRFTNYIKSTKRTIERKRS